MLVCLTLLFLGSRVSESGCGSASSLLSFEWQCYFQHGFEISAKLQMAVSNSRVRVTVKLNSKGDVRRSIKLTDFVCP